MQSQRTRDSRLNSSVDTFLNRRMMVSGSISHQQMDGSLSRTTKGSVYNTVKMIARTSARIIILAGKSSLESQAQNFRSSFRQIERFVRSHSGPYTAKLRQPSLRDKERKLHPTGHIEMWGGW